jgi:DNA topoisomerase-1
MKTITLNFVGKSSVPFNRTIEVSDELYEVIKRSQKNKKPTDEIFDMVDSGDVGAFLKEVDKSFSPKVLRTARCNSVLVENLKKQKITKDSTEVEKLEAIYNANYAIAKELNHQKNIGKNQSNNEEKAKTAVLEAQKKLKDLKKDSKKKLAEIDEKIVSFKEKYAAMPTMLEEKLTKLEEQKTKISKRLETQENRVKAHELKAKKTSETADIALGTSLGNYADPRIIYSWCKDVNLPIGKVYNKSLQEKFSWAENTPEDYWRKI